MIIKDEMSWNDDPVGFYIKTMIPFVVIGIAKEVHNADRGASLCVGGGGEIGVASVAKNTKMIICRRRAEKGLV